MDELLSLLTELVERGFGPKPESPRELLVDLEDAPDTVRTLATAMAANSYKLALGEYVMRHNNIRAVRTLDDEIDAARDGDFEDFDATLETAGANGGPFDASKSVLLCQDGGGMTALGVSWSGGRIGCVVVELEEPFEDNFLTHLTSPDEVIEFLTERAEGRDAPDLDTLRERLG